MVYFSASNDVPKAFSVIDGKLGTSPASQGRQTFNYPGAVPVVSANGISGGIVWLLEGSSGGTLHAYDASNLSTELYNNHMEGSRDALGSFVRFTVPTVVNGKVYVGTGNSLAVFGLLNQPAQPELSAVVNAASLQQGPVAPGSLISLYGMNLAPAAMSAASGVFSTSLNGVTLSINGIVAPLQFVGPGQINAQVPFEVAEGTATAELRVPGVSTAGIQFGVAPVAPGIFANGPDQGAVQNADGTPNTGDNPAAAGSLIAVYLTGQGSVEPTVATGAPAPFDPPARTPYQVTATIGGQPAALAFAGLSPGSVGVFQVNLSVPAMSPGSYPLQIVVNGLASNIRSIAIGGSR
jgi:uncharacterized protein (TIGR03437 family)